MNLINKSRNFIYRNARPLDLARWQYHFEGASAGAVLKALSYYQNEDGGFGHGIEADLWNEQSSPISTSVAINILTELECYDSLDKVIRSMLRYLEETKYQNENGWLLKTPENNKYPHAPWWEYSKETENGFHGKMQYNPTAEIVGFVLKTAASGSAIYEKALKLTADIVENVVSAEAVEMHEISCICELYSQISKLNLQGINMHSFEDKVKKAVYKAIEKDTSKWCGYVAKPSGFIKSTKSIFYNENKELCQEECKLLLNSQLEDGSWNIPWSWSAYQDEWVISKNWWKSNGIIKNLLFLRGMEKITG